LEQANDRCFQWRAGDGVHEPEECQSGNAIADLRNELPGPYEPKIAGEQQRAIPDREEIDF
jgi:hypothetical protein